MPFVKRDKAEEKELEKILEESEEVRRAVREYEANTAFRRALTEARKREKISQKELSKRTGLTQQSISRIETGSGNTTVETLMRYLEGIGYGIILRKTDAQ